MTVLAVEKLRSVGQSLWLGHLSRRVIGDGSLMRYIEDCSVTGLSFSPGDVMRAISDSGVYDSAIVRKLGEGLYGKSLVYKLIYEDVRYAADLLRPVHERTDGVDGWAVVPVSPLSAPDNETLIAVLGTIHERLQRPNALISLAALPDRLGLVEDLVFSGVPVNIVNLYSDRQYQDIAQAYLAGIERRIGAGMKAAAPVFATIDISRLEAALAITAGGLQAAVLAAAMARRIYRTMRRLNGSREWDRAYSLGAKPLRLVWTFSGGAEQNGIDLALYDSLIAPFSVISIPDTSIDQFIDQIVPETSVPAKDKDDDRILADSARAGLDVECEADRLQAEYTDRISREWILLLETVARKCARISQQKHLLEQEAAGTA